MSKIVSRNIRIILTNTLTQYLFLFSLWFKKLHVNMTDSENLVTLSGSSYPVLVVQGSVAQFLWSRNGLCLLDC